MPSNYTPNYQLNQWAAEDPVHHADFNADNVKLDAALKALDDAKADKSALNSLSQTVSGKASSSTVSSLQTAVNSMPKVAAGSYTGDGAASRTISLGFTPKAVLLFNQKGYTHTSTSTSTQYHYGGLAVTGSPVINSEGHNVLSIQTGGFKVVCTETTDSSTRTYAWSNSSGVVYHYLAIG